MKLRQEQAEETLATQSIGKLLVRLSVSATVAMLVMALYNVVGFLMLSLLPGPIFRIFSNDPNLIQKRAHRCCGWSS
jgi:Na+-driven multidrug efflux pump